MSSLLPPSATAAERAMEKATARISDVAVPIGDLWRPETCPADALPWLAWALSVDTWDASWPEETKRRVISDSIEIHRRRGTVWAVREALLAAGFAEATISEGLPRLTYDGSQLHDGIETYFGGSRWALFDLYVDLGETNGLAEQDRAALARLVDMAKPASRHLREMIFGVSLADEVEADEDMAAVAAAQLAEEARFGITYGGQINYDQAVLLAGFDAVLFDGTWRYGGEQLYSGLSKYSRWQVTGYRYDNERSVCVLDDIPMAGQDAYGLAAPPYDGGGSHDGAFFYGDGADKAFDRMAITLTCPVKYNGRHIYGGERMYVPVHTENLTA